MYAMMCNSFFLSSLSHRLRFLSENNFVTENIDIESHQDQSLINVSKILHFNLASKKFKLSLDVNLIENKITRLSADA